MGGLQFLFFQRRLELDFMDRRAQLQQDISFAQSLLERNGYHPILRASLTLAKRMMEEELSELQKDELGEGHKAA